MPDGTRAPREDSKQAQVLRLLATDTGATLADLMAATGWQAHSVRVFISATVRKKLGLNVESERVDGERTYRIAA
ncbi:DUF3489 domain-containing protein [Trinickia violacea]|uniref:DUF3489 domain-containing protein n=1 Tax=Trinickia violacea TaxID=2571746 RepID=UPI001586D01E|nr:DUF3489 domain-containing protein [Trinickia violacea]